MATAILGAFDPRRRGLRAAYRLHPLQPGQTWPGCPTAGLALVVISSFRAAWLVSARLGRWDDDVRGYFREPWRVGHLARMVRTADPTRGSNLWRRLKGPFALGLSKGRWVQPLESESRLRSWFSVRSFPYLITPEPMLHRLGMCHQVSWSYKARNTMAMPSSPSFSMSRVGRAPCARHLP